MNTLYHFFCKFAPLDQHEWEAARAAFQIRKLKKGEYLVEEGQVCRQIAFVAQGLLRLFYRLHGEEKIMLFFGEQSLASDYFSFLTGTKSIRPVQALEACELYCISAEALEELYRFKNWERVGRRLSEMAYTFAVQRANRLLHDDHDTRYLTLLREQPDLIRSVPQYMIASYLDMKPETLSRVRKRIARKQGQENDSVHQPLKNNPFAR